MDGLSRLYIDQDCFITTPLFKLIGNLLEMARAEQKHGNTRKKKESVKEKKTRRKKREKNTIEEFLSERIERLFLRLFRFAF